MELALFSPSGLEHLYRFFHFMSGIVWIGMLYYFNFVQTPFFAEADGNTKSGMIQKLVPRALWWFRYGALITFISGLALLHSKTVNSGIGFEVFKTAWGPLILTGAGLGTLMFLNVWLIIWPNQKIVIASAQAVAAGGKADPKAAAAGAWAGVASRTNALFSIPMLFFMGASAHLQVNVNPDTSLMPLAIALIVVILAIEANAVFFKKLGVLAKVSGVWHFGILLTALLYGLIEFLSK